MVAYLPMWLRGRHESTPVKEVFVSCPGCKAFETLWLKGNRLMPAKRFSQKADGKVYHGCGSEVPCRKRISGRHFQSK